MIRLFANNFPINIPNIPLYDTLNEIDKRYIFYSFGEKVQMFVGYMCD